VIGTTPLNAALPSGVEHQSSIMVSMPNSLWFAWLLLFTFSSHAAPPSLQRSEARVPSPPKRSIRVLYDGLNIVDVVAGAIVRERQLVVADGRIVAIRAAGTPAAAGDSLVVAFRGSYVMPGLIDTHVHLGSVPREPTIVRALLEAAAMGGVTTVRDMGGRGEIVRPLMTGEGIMPRVLGAAIMAGPRSMWFTGARAAYLSGGSDSASWVRRVEREADVAPSISAAKRAGASGIKLYSDLSRELVVALAKTARDSGLLVWSHAAIGPAGPVDAVDAGVQILSHADQLAWAADDRRIPVAGSGGALRDSLLFNTPTDDPRLGRLFAAMRAKGVSLEPTLTVMSGGMLDTSSSGREASKRFVGAVGALTLAAQRAGVNVVAGTDALGGSSPNIHAELALLVHIAGFTPAEALRAATVNAARALRREALGTIAAGQAADLVLLRDNPLSDIAGTQSVAAVLLGGRLIVRPTPMRTPPIAALFNGAKSK
jgi:imidazolonepropionase-like amidohydrolase